MQKKKRKTQCIQLIGGGLLWALAFLLLRNAFLGITFLMVILALLGLFAAFCGVLFWPYRSTKATAVVKWLQRFTVLGLTVLLLSFAVIEMILWYHADGDVPVETACIVVLGAGVYGERPSATLISRLDAAYSYLQTSPDCIAVLSGGQGPGEDITEALAMQRYLTAKGIDPQRLLLETQSTSTWENLLYTQEILRKNGLEEQTVGIVSNTFHLYRAQFLAQQAGMDVMTISAPVPKIGLVPLTCYVREYFAVMLMYGKTLLGLL